MLLSYILILFLLNSTGQIIIVFICCCCYYFASKCLFILAHLLLSFHFLLHFRPSTWDHFLPALSMFFRIYLVKFFWWQSFSVFICLKKALFFLFLKDRLQVFTGNRTLGYSYFPSGHLKYFTVSGLSLLWLFLFKSNLFFLSGCFLGLFKNSLMSYRFNDLSKFIFIYYFFC